MAIKEELWQQMRREYRGGATMRELSQTYGVALSTLGDRAQRENWRGPRRKGEDWDERMERCIARAAERLMDTVEDSLQSDAAAGTKELKDLTGVIRELCQLRRSMNTDREEDKEADGCVRVVLEGELEEWSQ